MDIESIEVEVQTIVCERPWLWPALFENKRWDWATHSQPISRGIDDESGCIIPAYIYALIFARNLMIKLKKSARAVPINLANVRSTASFLMQAIKPRAVPISRPENNPGSRFSNSPLARRNLISKTIVRARPAGPAVSSTSEKKNITKPFLLGNKFNLARLGATRLVTVRPGAIRKLSAKGRIVDENDRGVYKAMVILHGKSGTRQACTGRDGSFTFPSLEFGRYRLQASKKGFKQCTGAIVIPQKNPVTIRLDQIELSKMKIHLLCENGSPFTGKATVFIKKIDDWQVESMDGHSERIFFLSTGEYLVSVHSSEADIITPPNREVTISDGEPEIKVIEFIATESSFLYKEEIQLLGFVCKRVPKSPDPHGGV